MNIAASLMNRPRLVLLDEPTSGVDLAARAAIHAVLDRLKAAGTAILIATHDFAEAERLASRVAFLAQGRVVRAGRLAVLLAQLRTGAPERELSLAGPASGPAEGVLRRAGFVPAEAGASSGGRSNGPASTARPCSAPCAPRTFRWPRSGCGRRGWRRSIWTPSARGNSTDPEAAPLRAGTAG